MTAFNTSAGGVRERPPPKNETPGRGGSRPEADFKNSRNTTACKPWRAILQEMRATELRRLRRLRRVQTIAGMQLRGCGPRCSNKRLAISAPDANTRC
jgi:hypothetical protein